MTSESRVTRWLRMLINLRMLHPRLIIAVCAGIFVGFVLPGEWARLVRMVVAWDITAALYLTLSWTMMLCEPPERLRWRAAIQDESGWTILGVCVVLAIVSLGSIVGLLSGFKDLPEAAKSTHLILGVATLLCSWFFLHTLFTFHYAHEYYGAENDPETPETTRGGLNFPGGHDDEVGYMDFAYYAFTIGMTAQTSDTGVTNSTMRRLTLAHGVVSFFFNTVILALSINIAASLL